MGLHGFSWESTGKHRCLWTIARPAGRGDDGRPVKKCLARKALRGPRGWPGDVRLREPVAAEALGPSAVALEPNTTRRRGLRNTLRALLKRGAGGFPFSPAVAYVAFGMR